MKSNKEYRFNENPKEKEFHDKFIEMFNSSSMSNVTLSAIVFGWENDRQQYPKRFLVEEEKEVIVNIIQWLGSSVGQSFLNECGFYSQPIKNNR